MQLSVEGADIMVSFRNTGRDIVVETFMPSTRNEDVLECTGSARQDNVRKRS